MTSRQKRAADDLIERFAGGNDHPGIGSHPITDVGHARYIELRHDSNARVILHMVSDTEYVVVARFRGHQRGDRENNQTIGKLIRDYEVEVGLR